jgi:hypothetical protein
MSRVSILSSREVPLAGEEKYPFHHLMNRLNKRQNSYVAIMAYRNTPLGEDGAIMHAHQEIEYAMAYAARVHVLIAQETGEINSVKVTYHGMRQGDFARAVLTICQAFEDANVFQSIAVNDVASYLRLQ